MGYRVLLVQTSIHTYLFFKLKVFSEGVLTPQLQFFPFSEGPEVMHILRCFEKVYLIIWFLHLK